MRPTDGASPGGVLVREVVLPPYREPSFLAYLRQYRICLGIAIVIVTSFINLPYVVIDIIIWFLCGNMIGDGIDRVRLRSASNWRLMALETKVLPCYTALSDKEFIVRDWQFANERQIYSIWIEVDGGQTLIQRPAVEVVEVPGTTVRFFGMNNDLPLPSNDLVEPVRRGRITTARVWPEGRLYLGTGAS